jgi:hypothetical protein
VLLVADTCSETAQGAVCLPRLSVLLAELTLKVSGLGISGFVTQWHRKIILREKNPFNVAAEPNTKLFVN